MENNFESERANMRSLKARGKKCKSHIAQAKLRKNMGVTSFSLFI
jgi:hypothetical protein